MNMDFVDYKEELKKREYNFKCKIVRKTVHFEDDAYGENSHLTHADLILLIPYEGTERDIFMSAYYQDAIPMKNGEGHMVSKVELPTWISSPVSMPSMVRLNWPSEIHEHPYLMVMTYSIETLMNTYKNMDSVDVRIYPYDKMDELGLSDGVIRV
jgi:hypothetical protein